MILGSRLWMIGMLWPDDRWTPVVSGRPAGLLRSGADQVLGGLGEIGVVRQLEHAAKIGHGVVDEPFFDQANAALQVGVGVVGP